MHELELLERRGWDALSGPDGAAFYEGVTADEALMVFPGIVLDKAQSLRAIADAPLWSRYELSDIRVVEGTPDATFVTYRATAARTGEGEYRALMTTVYVRRERGWQLVLHQQTPFPDE